MTRVSTTSRRLEPGTPWRGATTGAGGFCETETGAGAAALDKDDADADASKENTMRLGLRGGDFVVPILFATAIVESRAALLLKGSICFLVELLDVGERL